MLRLTGVQRQADRLRVCAGWPKGGHTTAMNKSVLCTFEYLNFLVQRSNAEHAKDQHGFILAILWAR